jgi:hypothetical protein
MARAPRLSQDIQPLSEFRANTARFLRHVQETRRPSSSHSTVEGLRS